MKIQEVSEKTGISSSTLRYYEELKLISPVLRKGKQRVYDEAHMEQIQFVQCMKQTGMKLKDIQKYVDLYLQDSDEADEERLQLLAQQKEVLHQKMQSLQESIRYLTHKIHHVQKEIEKRK